MKAETLFKISIAASIFALFGIFIGYIISLMWYAFGTWFAFGCFIVLIIGLLLSLIALFMYAFE